MTTPTAREAAITAPPRVYYMTRHTIVAPHVNNTGAPSGYVSNLRQALMLNGIDGWTEYASAGYWRGKREAGTVLEIYLAGDESATLARIAARAMPDQEAIQITVDAVPVRLVEA